MTRENEVYSGFCSKIQGPPLLSQCICIVHTFAELCLNEVQQRTNIVNEKKPHLRQTGQIIL